MAVTPKRLYQGQPDTTASLLYTTPSGRAATIHRAVACNPTAGAVTITLHALSATQDETDADATNEIVHERSIAAGATEPLIELTGAVFEDGHSLCGLADTADSLTLTVWGSEIT